MGIGEDILLALGVFLLVALVVVVVKNMQLKKKNKTLQEIIAVKNTTISNYKASRVSVSEVMENFSHLDDVMSRINKGESRESVSKALMIPMNKVELIIKFDKIKKRTE